MGGGLGSLVVLFWLMVAGVWGQIGPQQASDAAWPPFQAVTTGVERRDGRPTFVVDGQPFFPIGVTYHFTRNRLTWDYDLRLMREMGLNTVRADLGWRDVEAVWEGQYRFDYLDQFLDAAARQRMRVVLVFSYATGDSDVPLWYWLRYGRDYLARIRNGSLLDARPSINDPTYRRFMATYIARTVEHVRGHPALLAYQVLNEPRYYERPAVSRDPFTVSAFRNWLQERYGQIGDLNGLWQTQYHSFDSVAPPGQFDGRQGKELPQQMEDWRQFSYEDLATFVEDLSRGIREQDPRHAVLVAEMSWWWWGQQPATGVSPWHVYRAADIVGFDVYPESGADAPYYALNADMLARYWDKPVWVMELNRKDGRPDAAEMRRFVQEAIDYGATGVFYFSWRDHWLDGGNYGLLDHWGQPKPQFRAFGETVAWLRQRTSAILLGALPSPNVYLIWPSSAVSRSTGLASPAWRIFDEAAKLRSEGLRVGLVDEGSVHDLPESAKVIRVDP